MSERLKIASTKKDLNKDKAMRKEKADSSHSFSSPTGQILYLQRNYGNHSIQEMFKSDIVQEKLKIGRPKDLYEQEADRVADQVIHMTEPNIQPKLGLNGNYPMYREARELQIHPLVLETTPFLQNQEENLEENEKEDHTNLSAQKIPSLDQRRLALEGVEYQLQNRLIPEVQFKWQSELAKGKEPLKTKQDGLQKPQVSQSQDTKAHSLKGSGQSLPDPVRNFFESRFGYNFGKVQIHTNPEAAELAQTLSAKAFVMGNDMVFGQGEFSPDTTSGKRLLAHELTHVLQQGGGTLHEKVMKKEAVNNLDSQRPGYKNPVFAHFTPTRDHILQRTVSADYSRMVNNLSYGILDWAITDEEAHEVLVLLQALSDTDLVDTVLQLERDGYLNRLLDNISDADQNTYASLIQKIHRARGIAETVSRIQSALSYGIFDWAITDEEAHEVLVTLNNMPVERRRVIVYRLEQNGYFDRLIDNISTQDRRNFATLISELNLFRRELSDLMQGTAAPTETQRRNVEALLTPGIVRDPVTNAPAVFVDVVAGRTYRQDIEDKLDDVRAWMYPQSQTLLARPRLPMSRFERIGEEAKRQTDNVFGHYASGPAFVAGTRASGANLIDRSLQTPDPVDLVRYLIHNQREVLPVHQAHSAIPSRSTEQGIIDAIIVDYSAAHRAELEVIDRAWPAVAGGGVVEIQPFELNTASATRRMFWKTFQTIIHEYLHTITHPNFYTVARSIGRSEASILIEGTTSLFTNDVWDTIYPAEVRANDQLRENVEGSRMPYDPAAIPPISAYRQIAQAQGIENEVGEASLRAAYFLGHTELIGLGPTWTPTLATTGQIFEVPSSGVSTVADVANITGASANDIASANGISVTDTVTPGQQLTVPGIRIHIVLTGETKTIIAQRNGVSEAQLDHANPGVNWTALTQGQRILIPVH